MTSINEAMNINKLLDDYAQIINHWLDELDQYNMHQLTHKPDVDSWSMGQLYNHLIDETKFFFSEVENCLATNENQYESMTSRAKEQFRNNSFPNERLKGPAEVEFQPQPDNKEQLKNEFEKLIGLVNEVGGKILNSDKKGKSRHPGLDYLNAKEWFQYAEMHLRHHLRQKERIDAFLRNKKN